MGIALWTACGLVRPQNNPRKDIARKLRVNPEWFLVAEAGGQIVGAVMAGYEGHPRVSDAYAALRRVRES